MEEWLDPCLDADQMRSTDRWAIQEQGVPSLQLMETAGQAVAEAAAEAAGSGKAAVVCGKGNNGGDGLVAARRLREMGFEVDALLLAPGDQLSEDARANLERFEDARHVGASELPAALEGAGVVVDAIFGTGFAGAPRDPAGSAIEAINDTGAKVVATDIASGVNASTGEVEGKAVGADVTVTFHAPKLGHWIAPGKHQTGELRVAPIGIPDGAPVEATAGLIGTPVLELAPHRAAGSTKFTSGQVVIVGGSRGLTGAVCLSALGAIRSGAGYATVAVPADLESIFEVKLTEVMSVGCASRELPSRSWVPPSARRASCSDRGWVASRAPSAWPVSSPSGSGPRWSSTRTASMRTPVESRRWRIVNGPWFSPPTRARWGGCSIGTQRRSRRNALRVPRKRPGAAERSWCSRATTRSSPTASWWLSTRSPARSWRRPARATS
jgi:hydroxyethylthiazole kinase-like uncharacterized protein yjeF